MTTTLQEELKTTSTKAVPVADTVDEIAKYEKLIDGEFIRVDEKGEPDKAFKKFTYRISNIFPSYFGLGNDSEVNMNFQVQKYWKIDDRNPDSFTVVPNEKGGGTTKRANKVIGHAFNQRTMRHNCIDDDAERLVKCREFEKQFVRISN